MMTDLSITALAEKMTTSKLKNLQDYFDLSLESYFRSYESSFGKTSQAAKYALFTGGKRLRPLLFLTTLQSFDFPYETAMHAAFSLEMIHTYSLIHDDLPAMDNDDFRRGKPTVHRAFNEGTAVLAGDLLLTVAFETLTKAQCDSSLIVGLIQSLCRACGPFGMICGQSMDLYFEGRNCTLNELKLMYQLKTGALIGASLEFAALYLKKPKAPFTQLGLTTGLAFQIKNDLEDTRHSDLKKQKATYLSISEDPISALNEQKEKVMNHIIDMGLLQSPLHHLIEQALIL